MFEAHLLVLIEERQGVIWVLHGFQIGEERYAFAKP